MFRKIKFTLLLVLFIFLIFGCEENAKIKFVDMKIYNEIEYMSLSYSENQETSEIDIENVIKSELIASPSEELHLCSNINQWLYIKIILENPFNLEISSVTINDIVYKAKFFEKSSNLSNIFIKVYTNDTPGIIEYQLNEIKYSEKNKIKNIDVRMSETLRVGILYANIPTVEVTNINVFSTKITFDSMITDENNIGKYYKLYLYDGSSLTELKDLSLNETNVEINNLKQLSDYQYAIVSEYDTFDGNGNRLEILYKNTFKTKSFVEISNVVPNENSISFELLNNDSEKIGKLSSISLYHNNELISSLDDLSLREFSNLEIDNNYRISISYEYSYDGIEKLYFETDFSTATRTQPKIKSVEILNSDKIYIGDKIEANIIFDNPMNDLIYSLTIDNEEIMLDVPGTTSIFIEYAPKTQSGLYQLSIDAINYKVEKNIINIKPELYVYDEIVIYEKDLDFISIHNEYNNNSLLPNENNALIIELDNPKGFLIENIIFSDLTYLTNDIEIINNNHLKIIYKTSQIDYGTKHKLSLNQITYKLLDGSSYTLDINKDFDFWILKSLEVIDVSTKQDLIDMQSGYSYRLTNNIDVNGINPLSFRQGILDGNGYKLQYYSGLSTFFSLFSGEIRNLEFSNFSCDYTYGFSTYSSCIFGIVYDDLKIINCKFNINTILAIDENNTTYINKTYIGGLISYNEGSVEIIDTQYEGFTDIRFVGDYSLYFGTYIGYNKGQVLFDNVKTNGDIRINAKYINAGGFIGFGEANIKNSEVNSNFSISNCVSLDLGGMIGYGNNNIVENSVMNGNIKVINAQSVNVSGIGNNLKYVDKCKTNGNIEIFGGTNTNISVGGISIGSYGITISNSSMAGNIVATGINRARVGGILAESNSKIYNCAMFGDITIDSFVSYVGGIVGADGVSWLGNNNDPIQYYITEIDNCKMLGNFNIQTEDRIFLGGIMNLGNVTLTNNVVYSDIKALSKSYVFIGGIIAQGYRNPLIDNCIYDGDITVNSEFIAYVGGIFGYNAEYLNTDMKINNVKVNGNFTVKTNLRTYTGGIIGYIDRRTIFNITLKNSKFVGNIDVETPHNAFAGGLISHSGTNLSIENCYVNGKLKAKSNLSAYVGGFVASGTLTIKKSIMAADIEASCIDESYVGGFLGYNKYPNPVNIEDCLLLGDITFNNDNQASINVNPYIGLNFTNGSITINNCYVGRNQTINKNNVLQPMESVTYASIDQLNSTDFYINNLKLDSAIWDLSRLDYVNGKYPKLFNLLS